MAGNKTSWSAAFSGVCDNSAEAADAFEKLFEEFVQRARSLPGAEDVDGNSNGQFYGSGFANAERHVHERDVKPASPTKPTKPGA